MVPDLGSDPFVPYSGSGSGRLRVPVRVGRRPPRGPEEELVFRGQDHMVQGAALVFVGSGRIPLAPVPNERDAIVLLRVHQGDVIGTRVAVGPLEIRTDSRDLFYRCTIVAFLVATNVRVVRVDQVVLG